MYNLKDFKKVFDPLLKEFLEKRSNEFLENTSDSFIKDFILYSDNLALSGGKRIRPYIAYIMYEALGGKDIQNALKILISIEIFHTFALIHDDIMDKADTRHGVDTLPTYVLKKLRSQERQGDLVNVANAQGILVGDLFFSWAMEIFLDNEGFNPKKIKKAHDYFYKMVDEVCLGQMLDIDITTRQNSDEKLIDEKTRLKTSRYTFVRPMQIGGALANPDKNIDSFSEELGTKLGIAFQLQDDLLDIIGDPKILEKNILRDIVDHQHTFFTNYVFQNGSEEQIEKLKSFFGKNVKEDDHGEIIKIFMDSGAIDKGKTLIMQTLSEAKEIIAGSDFNDEFKKVCLDLIRIMEERQK